MPFDGEILALDLSAKNTGIALGRPGEKPRLSSVSFAAPDDPYEVAAKAMEWVSLRLKLSPPAWMVAEARIPTSWGGTNANTTLILDGLAMIMGGAAKLKSIPWRTASVSSVRTHFIGVGNLKGEVAKPLVVARCRDLGWEPPNRDAADAAAVWFWQVFQLRPELALPAPTNWRFGHMAAVPQKQMKWGAQ